MKRIASATVAAAATALGLATIASPNAASVQRARGSRVRDHTGVDQPIGRAG